jgi:hypothetical protein
MPVSGLGRVTSNWHRASREISHVPASTRWPNGRFSLTMLQSPLLSSATSCRHTKDAVHKTQNYQRFALMPVLLAVQAGDVDLLLRCSRR